MTTDPATVIRARPLTADAFAPFGQVMMARGSEPRRDEFAARLESFRPAARANMTFLRVPLAAPPIALTLIERHRFSSQTFVPVNRTRYLVAACPSRPDGSPEIEALGAFVAEAGQAINFNADTWHAPRLALGGAGEFVVLRWDDGGPADTELHPLAAPIAVELTPGPSGR